MKKANWIQAAYWVSTVLFCVWMLFTAWWELMQVSQSVPEMVKLGFSLPAFRWELSIGKVIGAVVLVLPVVGPRAKEWAYCGFAINIVSAMIAHAAIHDVPLSLLPSSLASVLWLVSYICWRQLVAKE